MPPIQSKQINRTIHLVITLGLCTLISAYGGSPATQEVKGPNEVSLNKTEQSFDMNGDSKPDVWRKYVQKGKVKILASKSFDLNFDSKVDFKRFYTEKGKVLRDEMDMDFDGTYDRTIYYKNNVIDRKEASLKGDEKPEVFTYYKDGQLEYIAGDSDADGTADYFQYYNKEGRLIRRGFDDNGDGVPDRFIRLED